MPLLASAAIDVDPWNTTVVPGRWCGNFKAAKAYVETNDMPLVMVWGKVGCDHCTALEEELGSQAGLAWAAAQNAAFCFVKGNADFTDNKPNVGAYEFAGSGSTPCVCLYWPERKTVRFVGADYWYYNVHFHMYSEEGDTLLEKFQNSYLKFLSEVMANASFATFPMGNTLCDRLEAEAGVTAYVDVPLVRTNEIGRTASNKIVFDWNGSSSSQNVSWAADEKLKFVRYQIPAGFAAGEQVQVTLKEADGTVLGARDIWGVGEVENSPKNPYWIGEKTADNLQWGEWSMDLDAVTNKVRAYNGKNPVKRACAMILVEGSCWCPDCAMAEANFFSNQAFKDWARTNLVVFGVVDIPNNPQAAEAFPSLLRYDSYRTSDSYVDLRGTATADESQRYQSGAGYLARHSVSWTGNGGTNALDIAARNAFLVGHNTLNFGWNRPERENQSRTGAPVLILLRDDGTVAGRWNRFSDVGPANYSEGYLRRFEEMFAQIDDEHEEADDDRSTTARTIASGVQVASTVSAVDQGDVYAIADAVENLVARFWVVGDAKPLKAAVIDGESGTEIAASQGLGSAGFALSAKLGSSGSYFLKIAPGELGDGTVFGYTNEESTMCSYSVTESSGMSGGEFGFAVAATNVAEDCGSVAITVRRTAGANGDASVRVKLVEKVGEAVDERIGWTSDMTLNWADGEVGEKGAVLEIRADGLVRGDMRLGFELTGLTCAAEDKSISIGSMVVNVYDVDYFGMPVYCHVAMEDARAVDGYQLDDEVRVELRSGALPEGIELVCAGGTVRAAGCPRAMSGEYSATYAVTLVRGGSAVSCQEMDFDFTVIDYDFSADIPSLASVRTYGNLPLVGDGLLKGLLTVTVPSDGRLSAKYVTGGKAFAYAADGWTAFDKVAGRLMATLSCTTDGLQPMTVTIDAGGGWSSFADPLDDSLRGFELSVDPWPDGTRAWKGQYTVQMPQTNAVDGAGENRLTGAAFMALRMTDSDAADGRMLYAGMLPNGRAVYGSSILIADPQTEANALLPFYHVSDLRSAPYAFSGEFSIARNAVQEQMTAKWCVRSAVTPVWEVSDGFGRRSEFNVFGGYYDRDGVTARFNEDFAGRLDDFGLSVDSAEIVSGRYGTGSNFQPVAAEMTATNMPRLVDGATNPQDAVMTFSPETGVIHGSFDLPFADGATRVTYRGISLPGWQNCAGCIGAGAVERPWAVGACSFTDRAGAGGIYRNGCSIRLDSMK